MIAAAGGGAAARVFTGAGMDIGIIGAGQVGGTLAAQLTALGHSVVIANSRGPASLADVATRTGATAGTVQQAVAGKAVVIVTVTEKAIPDLPAGLFAAAAAGTVVVDTGNYYPDRDGHLAEIEAGLPESRWVERHLGRPVVKAFNTIQSGPLAARPRPKGASDRVALPVAGDDAAAKAVVLALVEAIGFDALDVGGLDDSWRQQPGTPVYCKDYDAAGVRRALAEARRVRTAEYRQTAAAGAAAYYAALAAAGPGPR